MKMEDLESPLPVEEIDEISMYEKDTYLQESSGTTNEEEKTNNSSQDDATCAKETSTSLGSDDSSISNGVKDLKLNETRSVVESYDTDEELWMRDLLIRMETLRLGNVFTDVTIVCEGEEIKAHAVVLCASSEVFQSLLDCKVPPSKIVFYGMSFEDLKIIIEFMYTGKIRKVEDPVRFTHVFRYFKIRRGATKVLSDALDVKATGDAVHCETDCAAIFTTESIHAIPNESEAIDEHKDFKASGVVKIESKNNSEVESNEIISLKDVENKNTGGIEAEVSPGTDVCGRGHFQSNEGSASLTITSPRLQDEDAAKEAPDPNETIYFNAEEGNSALFHAMNQPGAEAREDDGESNLGVHNVKNEDRGKISEVDLTCDNLLAESMSLTSNIYHVLRRFTKLNGIWAAFERQEIVLHNLNLLHYCLTSTSWGKIHRLLLKDRYRMVYSLINYFELESRMKCRSAMLKPLQFLINNDSICRKICCQSSLIKILAKSIIQDDVIDKELHGTVLRSILSTSLPIPNDCFNVLNEKWITRVLNMMFKETDNANLYMDIVLYLNFQFTDDEIENNFIVETLCDSVYCDFNQILFDRVGRKVKNTNVWTCPINKNTILPEMKIIKDLINASCFYYDDMETYFLFRLFLFIIQTCLEKNIRNKMFAVSLKEMLKLDMNHVPHSVKLTRLVELMKMIMKNVNATYCTKDLKRAYRIYAKTLSRTANVSI